MARQREITEQARLLYASGKLAHPGYSKRPLLIYDRDDITAPDSRIKEWDYYFISDGRIGVALTVADNGYMGLDSISILDFEGDFPRPVKKAPAAAPGEPWEHTVSAMQLGTFGRKLMPPTTLEGDVHSSAKRFALDFKNNLDSRVLDFHLDGFMYGKDIEGHFELICPDEDSIVVAIPFKTDEKAFYYNQKKNCMPATGYVKLGDETYTFDDSNTFAVLDWGRGVWTYDNTWYWGSASGLLDGHRFGFNIGYGFGDTSYASENILFYDGVGHKLDKVTFKIPRKATGRRGIFDDEFMEPWTFVSSDDRFIMDFEPIINRHAAMDFKFLCSIQNQVFGRFTGKAVLDDGTVLEIKDFFGFAEKVHNKW